MGDVKYTLNQIQFDKTCHYALFNKMPLKPAFFLGQKPKIG